MFVYKKLVLKIFVVIVYVGISRINRIQINYSITDFLILRIYVRWCRYKEYVVIKSNEIIEKIYF